MHLEFIWYILWVDEKKAEEGNNAGRDAGVEFIQIKIIQIEEKLTWKSKFQCRGKFHHALKFFDFLELWEAKSL